MNVEQKDAFIDACLQNVPFDGWTAEAFSSALNQTETDPEQARVWFPRGAVDVAVAFHERSDRHMRDRLRAENLLSMRYSERVAFAIRVRLEAMAEHKEAVRRASTLFALPHNAAEGARLVWGTADAIWVALGDNADDYNWYTKRATLSGVYGSTVLYWLGDDSPEHEDTWAFLDRRIANVMQVEKLKSQAKANPVLSRLMAGPNWVLSQIKPPMGAKRDDLPGTMRSEAE